MKLLVLVPRGLRAGILGPYGNPWIETPSIDTLASRGVVFDWHYADRADPEGARRAWRSGRYDLPRFTGPPAEGVPPPDLLAVLRERGVFTGLIVDASRPAVPAFEAGWDEVLRVLPSAGETALETTLEAARASLEDLASRDHWLLWVELGTPLPPWDVPDEFRAPYFDPIPEEQEEDEEPEIEDEDEELVEEEPEEESEEEGEEFAEEPLERMVDLPEGPLDLEDDHRFLSLHASYGSAVSYLDAGVGALLEVLAGRGLEDVAVLLTSDHGLPLGEHGELGLARPVPHEERLHLPLLLRLPGNEAAGRHVQALTQSVDLAATIAAWFGATLPGAHGQDLLPLARWQAEQVRPYACAGVEANGEVGWVLRTPDYALSLRLQPGETTPVARLYVKPDDVWEVNDVFQHHHDLAEQLERTLRAFAAVADQPGPLIFPALEAPPEPDTDGTVESVGE